MSIGVDIENVNRFKGKTLENDSHFLNSIFTENELKYSFSDVRSAQHLCARYCAKEATVKALTAINITDVKYKDIEILNNENKVPYITIKNHEDLNIQVSLSHTKDYAVAFVTINY